MEASAPQPVGPTGFTCSTDISRVSLSEDDPTETKEVPQEVPEDVIEEIPQELPQDIPEEPPEEADRDQAAEGEQHLSSLDSLDWELQDEGDGSLLMDSPGGQDDSCPQETPEEPGASAVAEGALTEQHCVELLGQLMKQRDEALSHSSQLQARVPQYIKRTSRRSGGLDSQVSSEEQQQMYQQNLEMLRDLKEQLVAKAQQGDRQVEELARQCQEKKKKVDAEWGAFLAQKKEAAVPELSRRLGGPAARAKVASILEEEQQQQEELVKERLRNIRLSTGIHRLQAGLRGWAEQRDPVQVQFEQLQARRLEQKKQAEKDKERSVKMQQKIRSSLELLSNMKEKIFLSQTQVRLRREELVQLEAQVARRRDLLLQTQQACSSLHQDNARLRVEWGLLGHRTLLHDLELTVDTTNNLEKHLQELKERHKEQCKGRGQRRSTP